MEKKSAASRGHPPATRVNTTRVDSSLRKHSVSGQTKTDHAGRRQPRKTIEREGHDVFPCSGFNLLELVDQNCRRAIGKTASTKPTCLVYCTKSCDCSER